LGATHVLHIPEEGECEGSSINIVTELIFLLKLSAFMPSFSFLCFLASYLEFPSLLYPRYPTANTSPHPELHLHLPLVLAMALCVG
jgi:hypothetical protein